ncbi:LuxR family transcriptional regulator [Saccharothrix syringae]|uniref:Helix-turn-helix transcriptional regulator n=1 Tax=Saccharothrix syringae TaxID=103733 RepID=A0A5Q0H4I1_SACSY|nr:LuxR family transcriptional regulator [Saccharothrix syringae]QFZ21138.1 helix-turn-helix transcriptional regulator [Saccharothrix syringae]
MSTLDLGEQPVVRNFSAPARGLRLVRVIGERGKSTALGELVRSARERDVPALVVRPTEADRMVPFGAVREALRQVPVGVLDPSAQDAVLLLRAVLHSVLTPGLDAERHRVQRAVVELVDAIATPSGLLLAVDDAHLADPASLELLDRLARHRTSADLLVAVAHRPGYDLLPSAEVVEVHPIALEHHPLVDDRGIAEAAAVLGTADPHLVAAVAGTTRQDAHRALARLTAAEVLDPDGHFRYASQRRHVYEAMDPEQREAAHHRAARALLERGVPLAVRAHHVTDPDALVEAANTTRHTSPTIALHWLRKALRARPDHEGALRGLAAHHDDRAVDALLDGQPADRAEIALRHALAHRAHGRHAAANALLNRELTRATNRTRPEGTRAADANSTRPAPAAVANRAEPEPGAPAAGTADRTRLDTSPTTDRALLHLGLATDPTTARNRADDVIATARHLQDPALLALALGVRLNKPVDHRTPALLAEARTLTDAPPQALLWFARAELALEQPRAALEHLERATRRARAADRHDLLPHLALAQGEALERLGRLNAAVECYLDAWEAPAARARSLAGRSRVALWRGDAAGAVRLAREAVRAGRDHVSRTALAKALLSAGEPDRAVETLHQTADPDPLVEVTRCAVLALAEGARNRPVAAIGWAERARALGEALPLHLGQAYVHLARVGALRPEAPTEAANHAVRAAAEFEAGDNTVLAAHTHLAAAALFRLTGRAQQERQERERSRALLDRCEPGLADRLGVSGPADHGLTDREQTVLAVLAEGLTAEAIARRMDISPRTVHRHLQHVYRKLGTTDRLSTVLRAQSLGLLTDVRVSC